jgi:hypothetical protein
MNGCAGRLPALDDRGGDMTSDNLYRAPDADLALPAEPAPPPVDVRRFQPFQLAHLRDLFFRPSRFFAPDVRPGPAWAVSLACWLMGISYVIDRIDIKMMQADVAGTHRNPLTEKLVASWDAYWAALLIGGTLAGAMIWFIGGWWYRLRLRWSGAVAPDAREARLAYVFAGLVFCLPALIVTLLLTLRFESYAAAWSAESLDGLLLPVFMVWSCATGWLAARTKFGVTGPLPLLLFLILPVLVYMVAIGGFAYIYYRFAG